MILLRNLSDLDTLISDETFKIVHFMEDYLWESIPQKYHKAKADVLSNLTDSLPQLVAKFIVKVSPLMFVHYKQSRHNIMYEIPSKNLQKLYGGTISHTLRLKY